MGKGWREIFILRSRKSFRIKISIISILLLEVVLWQRKIKEQVGNMSVIKGIKKNDAARVPEVNSVGKNK